MAVASKNDKDPTEVTPPAGNVPNDPGTTSSGTPADTTSTLSVLVNWDPDIQIDIAEKNGALEFTLAVTRGGGDVRLGDLQGIFFDFNETYLSGLGLPATEAGVKVSGTGSLLFDIDKDNVSKIQAGNQSINIEGNSQNEPTLGPHREYDIGVRFGSNGAGKDYITNASFTLSSANGKPLTLDLIKTESFALRLTSVGAESTSLKLTGHFDDVSTSPDNPVSNNGGSTDVSGGNGGDNNTGGSPSSTGNPGSVKPGQYDDLIEAGDGNDFIHGGAGNDEMQGEGGDDTIYGGTDNGEIAWNPGNGKLNKVLIGDNLYGNDGHDTYRYAAGDGVDMIWDFRPGEDVIELTGYSLSDIKATWVGKVANWIDTPKHEKLAMVFSNGGAIVFNDYSGLDTSTATAIKLADGTSLSFAQLLKMAGAKPSQPEVSDTREVAVRHYDAHAPGKDLSEYGGNDNDKLLGAAGDDNLYGNEGVNGLNGKDGDDQLFGGNSRDAMLGGTGNDIGYGNGGDDLIVGGDGSDRLYGAGGVDYIFGDDIPADIVLPQTFLSDLNSLLDEKTLVTSVSMAMADGALNLTASGNSSVNLAGNKLNNVIVGNSGKNTINADQGDDTISGGSGDDVLSGGAGHDNFVFDTKLGTATTNRKVNFDKITDFSVKDDGIWLDDAVFKKVGHGNLFKHVQLNKNFFTTGHGAKDGNDYLIYNKDTGVLSYDADGSGSKYKAVEFAQLQKKLALNYKDFFVI